MKSIYISFITLTLSFQLLYGCKKSVQVKPAPDLVITGSVFASEKTALSAVSGVYASLRSNNSDMLNGGLSLYTGLAADELSPSSSSATPMAFYQNQLLPTTSTVNTTFYTSCYKNIYNINAILDGLAKSANISESIKKQFAGEMKTIRALRYFYLLNIFGDVPLITSIDYNINAVLPREKKSIVYQKIIDDLITAKKDLADNYPSTGKARINKAVATALLSRIYLFTEQWDKAETEATSIIDSEKYTLLPATQIASVFLKDSPESIWEILSPNEFSPPGDGVIFNPSSAAVRPPYFLTPTLLNAFEPADARRTNGNWVDSNKVGTTIYYYPKKYRQKNLAANGTLIENLVALRLAEQYLIRAEARAHLNVNLPGAINDLDKIRTRAGLPGSSAQTQDEILAAIAKEWRIEFFAESGHRWLNLKRTGKADQVLSIIKGATWQPTDALFPIPEKEISYNPNLVQNPGY
ncbi:MAG: RagB/SusD family nutrient uptake outer membrane protein [Chitinophagaceae bacterium]|nr:MAG: RagB/SusD family nutrient uptake outer membrane protein [Chitinophagaceae bacterium]